MKHWRETNGDTCTMRKGMHAWFKGWDGSIHSHGFSRPAA